MLVAISLIEAITQKYFFRLLNQEDFDDFKVCNQCHFSKEIFVLYLVGVHKFSSRYDEVSILH